ncbi:MAG: hypothetical protein GY845_03660, partial [Planctomycetes bacterium]|nr:hypothetical protein [Planctomycetota bacterium]
MKIFYFGKMVALLSIATLLCLSSCLLSTVPVNAEDGGIAISGSFYRQPFELTQGSSISGPSIYVVVFNNGESEINIRMVTLAPQKVNMILSHSDFKLAPGGQQKVFIEVEAHEDAIPGNYEILVTAESYKENQGGIQLMGAAGQSASLTITGESAKIIAKSVSPTGEPIQATIRIFKLSDGNQAEIDYSETGVLETTVSPGKFKAEAYVAGEKLAEETINLANGDEKTITLVVGTVYFASFGGVPHYHS